MGERRFVIREAYDSKPDSYTEITESELKRRLRYIVEKVTGIDRAITILLHGEGGSVVHACPPQGESVTPCCNRSPLELSRTDRITSAPELVTCHGEREKGAESQYASNDGPYIRVYGIDDQPSPTPTRAEWDVWAENVASKLYTSSFMMGELKAALLSMPIVPKVDEEDVEEIQGQIEREEL